MPKVECIWGESTQSTQAYIDLIIFYSRYYVLKNIFLSRLLYYDSFALICIGIPKKPCTLENSVIKIIILVGKGLVLECQTWNTNFLREFQ